MTLGFGDYGDGLYLDGLAGEFRAALVIKGRLEQFLIHRHSHPAYSGGLYWGKVTDYRPDMEAAFVDLGEGLSGFLPRSAVAGGKAPAVGNVLPLKVLREPFEGKGPGVTSLLSKKEQRFFAQTPYQGKTCLVEAADSFISWLEAIERSLGGMPIYSPSHSLFKKLGRVKGLNPALFQHLPQYPDLFARVGLEGVIEDLLKPQVKLEGGGSLLIEPCRTLCAIDVNAGSAQARQHLGNKERSDLKLAITAVQETARQLRLRNLAGRIVVDLPRLHEKRALFQALKSALKIDPLRCKILPLHASGLLELTRARKGPSLYDVMTRPIGDDAMGHSLSQESFAYTWARSLLAGKDPPLPERPDEVTGLHLALVQTGVYNCLKERGYAQKLMSFEEARKE